MSAATDVLRGTKYHLDYRDKKDTRQCNRAWHGRVVFCPEVGQTRVSEGGKRRGEKMHKCSCDENSGSKVTNEEEKRGRDMEAMEPCCQDRECTGDGRSAQDDEESRNVQWEVVRITADSSIRALGSFHRLSVWLDDSRFNDQLLLRLEVPGYFLRRDEHRDTEHREQP